MKQVAILGSGKIGCDLLCKIMRSPKLRCYIFSGRRNNSPGLLFAQSLHQNTSSNGLKDIIANKDEIEIVFDTTSAEEHLKHKSLLLNNNFKVINLTPAASDFSCIPAINIEKVKSQNHISMITCGGQASIPIIYAVTQVLTNIEYIEVVTTIAAKSAGSATRFNIGEYQDATEKAISTFSQCSNTKSILVINPAEPSILMQTCIYIKTNTDQLSRITKAVNEMEIKIQRYVPGFKIMQEPTIDEDKIFIILQVQGEGHYLPVYAGNLDIITSAATRVAEAFA